MLLPELLEWIGLALLCVAASVGTVAVLGRSQSQPSAHRVATMPGQPDAVFLLEDDRLIDSSPVGEVLLSGLDEACDRDITTVTELMTQRFSGIETLEDAPSQIVLASRDPMDEHELLVEKLDNMVRFEVRPVALPGLRNAHAPEAVHVLEAEYDTLRSTMDQAPYPIWRVTDEGAVDWYNAAYADLYRRANGTRPDPAKRLFQSALDNKPSGSRIRASVSLPGTDSFLWYDVWIVRHDGYQMFYAVDVGAVVTAEIAQRNFVQTLTKTFAQLSIGLAIFDRNRQLALFNPALIDLTALNAEFLSARPNLLSFFDRLRDARMMPEPKDYASWRDQLADLVAAAADGRYQETWSLPSGSIYQVSGRPHPDGAVAFLFEDITAEVSLTRRFRSELEMGQSILDHTEEAIAVFAANGVLTLSNAAYRALWSVDPDASFADVTILDATRDWQSRSLPTPVWGDLRDFVAASQDRATWWGSVTLSDGREIICTVHPILDGATMVSFRSSLVAQDRNSVTRAIPADAS